MKLDGGLGRPTARQGLIAGVLHRVESGERFAAGTMVAELRPAVGIVELRDDPCQILHGDRDR